jgi:O-antigen/teichoic acid export membrane protein
MLDAMSQNPAAPIAAVQGSARESVSLRRNFAWTVSGNVVYAACQWGILIIIAKLGTPTMMGQFALGLAISAPVFMMTSLQLRTVLATDARDEYRLGNYLALRVLGTALGLTVIGGFVLVSGLRRETAVVVLLVSLAKAAEAMSDIIYGFWQKHEHFDKIAIALSGRGLGSVAAMGAVLYLTRSVALSTAAMAIFWALWLVTYERGGAKNLLSIISAGERLRPEWDRATGRQLVVLALPLGFVGVLASLNANVPRYFIEHYWGEQALGYFASAAYLQVAGNTFILALCQSAAPRLARYYRSSRDELLQLITRMVVAAGSFGLAGILVAVFFGRRLLELFYRPEYAQYHRLLVWLMVAGAVNYVVSVLCQVMTASRILKPQLVLFFLTTLVIGVSSGFFVPRFGLEGAAYAMIVGALVCCFGAVALNVVGLRSRAETSFAGKVPE